MNKKQKIIAAMWKNYIHNCKMQGIEPLYNYRVFKWSYQTESIDQLMITKDWYKEIRI